MNRVVAFNSTAIVHLKNGETMKAISDMKDALQCFRYEIQKKSGNAEYVSPMDTSSHNRGQNSHGTLRSILLYDEDVNFRLAGMDNLFVFYHRAFDMTSLSTAVTDVDRCQDRYLAVLLYNMGLIYYVASLKDFDEQCSSSLLLSATRAFLMALNTAGSSWDKDAFDNMRCLLLALSNNLGFLYCQQQDFEKTKDCLDLVLDLFAYPDTISVVPKDDFESLYFPMSVFCLNDGPVLTLAPCA